MLILVVVERRRDIAILSALGAKRTGVMLVFVIEGAVVGAIGALTGVLRFRRLRDRKLLQGREFACGCLLDQHVSSERTELVKYCWRRWLPLC